MNKLFIVAMIVLLSTGAAFACSYNSETHVLTECDEYKENKSVILDGCKEAHSQYNKYVASVVGKKAATAFTRAGNSISKFIGEKVKADSSEKDDEE